MIGKHKLSKLAKKLIRSHNSNQLAQPRLKAMRYYQELLPCANCDALFSEESSGNRRLCVFCKSEALQHFST